MDVNFLNIFIFTMICLLNYNNISIVWSIFPCILFVTRLLSQKGDVDMTGSTELDQRLNWVGWLGHINTV